MPSRLWNIFARRLLGQSINLGIRLIYSEEFSDFEEIAKKLSRNGDESHLLRAYIAIQVASRLTEPLSPGDVDEAFMALSKAQARGGLPSYAGIVELHRQLAELYWLERKLSLLKGKYAHKKNQYSLEGTIYAFQYANKGQPLQTNAP